MSPRRADGTYDIEADGLPDQPDGPVLLLTMRQTAALCQVSLARVREWTMLPGFPVIRSAHMVRVHARLLEEWLADQARAPRHQENAA